MIEVIKNKKQIFKMIEGGMNQEVSNKRLQNKNI